MAEVLWLIMQSWKWPELHLEIQSQITSNHLWEGYLYGIPLFLCVLALLMTFSHLSLLPSPLFPHLPNTIFNKSSITFPSIPLSPYTYIPPYIYARYFTQSCVNIQVIYRHYLSICLVLSIYLIYPLISYLISIIFIINIPYIYLYPISYIPMTTYVLYLL